MEDTYKGESPSKKYARFIYWSEVLRNLGNQRFYGGKHMILASREGGDISTLLGLGCDVKNIIAVERNPEAAYEVQEKYPEVHVVCTDVVSMAKEYRRELASVYLDFCGTLTEKLITTIMQVALNGLKEEAMIGVTMLSGREQGDLAEEVEGEKRMFEARLQQMSELTDLQLVNIYHAMSADKDGHYTSLHKKLSVILESGDKLRISEEAKRLRQQHRDGHEENATMLARVHYLQRRLQDSAERFRLAIQATNLLEYQSATKESRGVPMSVGLFRTLRLPKMMPVSKFHMKLAKLSIEWGFPHVTDCTLDDLGLRREILSWLAWVEKQHKVGVVSDESFHYANDRASLLWNVPKETISAWKAHATRGTYKEE